MDSPTHESVVGSQAKKRRRKSSGKCKAAIKELVSQSKERLLSQNSDSEGEQHGKAPKLDQPTGPSSLDHSNLCSGNPTTANPVVNRPADQVTDTQNPTAEFTRIHKPHKPSANVTTSKGRQYTVSIALPGSIVNNAQTWELKTALVGQIARACAIFSVNEIVIFDESAGENDPPGKASSVPYGRAKYRTPTEELEQAESDEGPFQPSHFVARILEYLECPQYLRKSLFPLHPDLRLAGLLPPLDLPHHFRKDHDTPWREGCILPSDKVDNYVAGSHHQLKKKHRNGNSKRSTSWADVGLAEPVQVALDEGVSLPDWTRVTVQMPTGEGKMARLISPRLPTQTTGIYWGYSIRLASSISKVFTETPYASDGGYDLTIGTSERGQNVDDVVDGIGEFKHMLLVLGGLSGLELSIATDDTLEPRLTAADAPLLFDHWLNTLPFQGSRTVRTEEALLVSLGALRRLLFRS
ncbi:hypothetical protein MJO28_007834 [Puccinia striiformis f. sp. tritici]|uniref:DUF171-domain-containing protein n=2 Tax=Puccinia striiformis f. sp. tritici TaxID=168172 RepID=A0A0L0V9X9_9BASI|nr:hypothetical protein Pst134EA_013932 [Puccinia striiformis f. sp. tritici]KNE96097.1 hypothetical protein PSTG_10522 [Puccinia striiformis f. sp. tritici PST-78]KAH9454822.1 hypothetical protein Pst134EB_014883 [Puccinia striiformis f. sp. tritici]KAH9466086.1 hypothetical protein Pst134EA_013932 [Puccinia striiformis f. sp. tritici]KAI7952150.1 hypothetical protein MJO28_007834 [Puccinia striiformis f. sp. tritici]KAI7956368.1 hypothetical protein MJO29_007767 [Puccinia striiformis f. sp. 